jgi:alginate O-acetyltransferase complex protein AlgI
VNVPSLEFLGLAIVVAALLAISERPRWRATVFLIANFGFVLTFSHEPTQLAPFALLLAGGYVAMRCVQTQKNPALFTLIVGLLIVAFCWLKRYAFFPPATLLPGLYMTVGMSYVFFRILSLVVDSYQGSLPDRVGAVRFLNYTLNFTSFVSGPIQFYRDYRRDESERPARLDLTVAARALERIVIGFFKVLVVSPVLGYAHQRCIVAASSLPSPSARVLDATLILALFPVLLYVNFSGYTDVVIGAARFLRLDLPENFDRPFSSKSYLEFWSRWHMSLSNWFKTYVYSPLLLALMRRLPSRSIEPFLSVVVYFATFFLVGLWHGQTTMFVLLGLLMGLGISGNKLFQIEMIRRMGRTPYRTLCSTPLCETLSRGLTFLWLSFTLVFFWATWPQLTGLAAKLGVGAIATAMMLTLVGAGVVLSAFTALVDRYIAAFKEGAMARLADFMRPAWYTTLAVITMSVVVMLDAPAPHIIYRGF